MCHDNYGHDEFYLKTNIIMDSNNNHDQHYDVSLNDSDVINKMMSNLNTTHYLEFYSNNVTNAYDYDSMTTSASFNHNSAITKFTSQKENPFDYVKSYSPIVDRHHNSYASFF